MRLEEKKLALINSRTIFCYLRFPRRNVNMGGWTLTFLLLFQRIRKIQTIHFWDLETFVSWIEDNTFMGQSIVGWFISNIYCQILWSIEWSTLLISASQIKSPPYEKVRRVFLSDLRRALSHLSIYVLIHLQW